jgi:hypothetical protein
MGKMCVSPADEPMGKIDSKLSEEAKLPSAE